MGSTRGTYVCLVTTMFYAEQWKSYKAFYELDEGVCQVSLRDISRGKEKEVALKEAYLSQMTGTTACEKESLL